MSEEVTIVEQGGLVRPGSMEEIKKQIELLASMNLPPTMAERYEVAIRDGWKVLRKRDRPIKFVLEQAKYNVPITNTTLPSERFYRRTKPSRFDDEHRATAISTIDIKEAFYS